MDRRPWVGRRPTQALLSIFLRGWGLTGSAGDIFLGFVPDLCGDLVAQKVAIEVALGKMSAAITPGEVGLLSGLGKSAPGERDGSAWNVRLDRRTVSRPGRADIEGVAAREVAQNTRGGRADGALLRAIFRVVRREDGQGLIWQPVLTVVPLEALVRPGPGVNLLVFEEIANGGDWIGRIIGALIGPASDSGVQSRISQAEKELDVLIQRMTITP